jgi:hypothetical protein
MEGWDCSGLVIEGLRSVGILPKDGDWTADSLLNVVFKDKPRLNGDELKPGCLVFFANQDGHIFHVEIVLDIVQGRTLTIGAAGGGHTTTNEEVAEAQNAYVKIRPRDNWTYALDPFDS